jgi:hypothetical protein
VNLFNELPLTVMESEVQDANRQVVRIDLEEMNKMGLSDGDLVDIVGESTSKTLTCLELLPVDTSKGIIRIDRTSRNEVGVKIGDKIIVRRVSQTQNLDKECKNSNELHLDDVNKAPSILISGSCIDFETERPKIMGYLSGLEMEVHLKDKIKCYSDGKKTLGWDFFQISLPLQLVEKLVQIHPEINRHEGVTLELRFALWLYDRMKKVKLDHHLKLSEIPYESVSGFRLNPKDYHDPDEINQLK